MNVIADDFSLDEYFDEQQADTAKVKPASHWRKAVEDRFHGESTASSWKSTGFRKMDGMFELRPSEVTIWAGVNGHGKTTALSHTMLNVMRGSQKVCLASLEMPPAASMAKMTRQAGGVEVPALQFIGDFHTWTDNRLWIYDHVGRVAPKRMLALATYVRKELGIDHLVIDSLMKCGLGTDDYTAQKDFVDGLCSIARDTGLHIHLVAHMRKGESEHKPADKFDVKGAGEITDLVDNLVIVWKDQRKADQVGEAKLAVRKAEHMQGDPAARDLAVDTAQKALRDLQRKPDALIRIAKQRHFEFEGKFVFWFHKASQQFLEKPDWQSDCLREEELFPAHHARAHAFAGGAA